MSAVVARPTRLGLRARPRRIPPVPRHRTIRAVADWYDLDVDDLCARSRLRALVRARWVAYLLLEHAGLSQAAIARAFGLRDHSTVGHGLRRIAYEPELLVVARAVRLQLEREARA